LFQTGVMNFNDLSREFGFKIRPRGSTEHRC